MKNYRINEHVKVYKFGNPIETGAVIANKIEAGLDLGIDIVLDDENSNIHFKLKTNDVVYGLGANLGGINKRGRRYESYCTDEPHHTEDKNQLYGAHNFFIIAGETAKGYFIDFPSRISYDVGFTNINEFNIKIHGKDFYIYEIEGNSLDQITSNFLKIIGKAYVPPKWGFGYFQSRWGYSDKDEVKQVYDTFRENKIPIDGIYLDLDYMKDFKDFSLNEEKFSDFKTFVTDLKDEGIYLIPIIDAGVKIEKGYDIYEEGIKGDHFCKDENGLPYVAGVWPGRVHFPDFLNTNTQQWFGSKYKFLTDFGIEGVWNDMNEPAIFYDEESLQDALDLAANSRDKNLEVYSFFQLKDKFGSLANKDIYYESFYHDLDGLKVSNHKVHNLYGYLMTKSANMGLSELLDNKRFVLISRASSIGMHRYGGIWTGDNSSWWPHLELNIKMMPSLNMCGFFYTGADTGGFGSNCNGELLVRWLQFSVFTPLLRNHSAIGCNNQEPYAFGKEIMELSRSLINKRYSLIPYIYSEFMKSVNEYKIMFKPLSFEYDGNLALEAENQLLLGNEIMITPVYKANQKGRYVYVPEKMALISFKEEDVYMELVDEGLQYIDYKLEDFRFFLRKDSLIPYGRSATNVKSMDISNLKILAYVENRAEYNLYDDDGISYDFESGEKYNTRIIIECKVNDFKIHVDNNNPNINTVEFTIIDSNNNIHKSEIKL